MAKRCRQTIVVPFPKQRSNFILCLETMTVGAGNVKCELRTSTTHPTSLGYKMNWNMRLQRQNANGSWSTIGTRTGYVARNSNSNRTFTDVKKTGRYLRVAVEFPAARATLISHIIKY